ncbi:Hemolysin C [Streptomyces sp. YIM 121038]|uniref:hemolysin family protein n=1 Tax=Streptomyces sp. YIM 121038 TaxID=2136401 RepID=UPI001110D6D9|nr:hemolysin family protein [Streptomyces sp. YIM 121038]QCX74974.1 Hemolysin C [Streptomyces sp. YIM 121038]
MTEVLLLLVAVLLSLACGVFVAAEFSLTTVERSELESAAERGERGAESALKAVKNLTFQLSGAQLGITVTGLVVGMLAKPAIGDLIEGPLGSAGVPEGAASTVALLLGTALSTVFLMVVGELVPKNWAISSPLPIAKRVATPQRIFSAAFRPFITHLNNTANRAVRRMGMEPAEELASARGPKELAALARHSAKEGALEAEAAERFMRTLNLADLTAENVMTPRVQVVALEAQATCQDVANATRGTGLSRFPVYQGSLDTVVGVVHIKDVIALPAERRPRLPVRELMREPLLVPESLTVDRLLDRLSGKRTMAVVIDEYGGTAGVATLEDIVEEVVGEVHDEHDPHETPDLAAVGTDEDGRELYSADGSARTDELARVGLRVPDGPYETLAGVVATELGRIPAVGDRVDVGGWHLEVVDAGGRRAARVLLHAPAPSDDADAGDGEGDGYGREGRDGGRTGTGAEGRGNGEDRRGGSLGRDEKGKGER